MSLSHDASKMLARAWSSQVLRFLVVGAVNTVVGYGLYLGGLWIGLPYQAALVAATVLGVIFNFFSTGGLVFANRAPGLIVRFAAGYGVTLAVNLVLLTLLVRSGVSKALAQAILLAPMVIASFLVNKYLVFGKTP
jgi:putative flippase GtrA